MADSEDVTIAEVKENKSISVDGQTVTKHNLASRIEFDRYREHKKTANNPFGYLKFMKANH
jgi:hypothetical protein